MYNTSILLSSGDFHKILVMFLCAIPIGGTP
nr:MAG TPA: hypothetical protein [Caudoviricetes sp.]